MDNLIIWIGILFCVSQSAMFSGLNLAFFSFTRLRLEIEAEASNKKSASRILNMRKDSNFLLTTILWGNVGINVLLTLLSDSVMAGVASFLFSTFVITLFGEITPQAYFSRNALKMASLLTPVLKFYQILLFPVAKPSALLLDYWLGKESVEYFAEKNIKIFIKKHMDGYGNEIDQIEGIGAINFLSLDDLKVIQEGEELSPESIIQLNSRKGELIFPTYTSAVDDPFLAQINKSGKKWVVLTDENNQPKLVLDADGFIRSSVFCEGCEELLNFCHEPIVISDNQIDMGELLKTMRTEHAEHEDHPIEKDVVLFWAQNKRIITGADILGRLLKGM